MSASYRSVRYRKTRLKYRVRRCDAIKAKDGFVCRGCGKFLSVGDIVVSKISSRRHHYCKDCAEKYGIME